MHRNSQRREPFISHLLTVSHKNTSVLQGNPFWDSNSCVKVCNELHFPLPANQGCLWVSLAMLSEDSRGVIIQGNKMSAIGPKSKTHAPEGTAEQCWAGNRWLQGQHASTWQVTFTENKDRSKPCSAVGRITPRVPVWV